MSVERVLALLDSARQTGPDRWLARCPAHDDRSPSLSIRATPDGAVLVHCFGGCATADVLSAVGLEMGDLFERPLTHHLPPTKARIPASDALVAIDHEAQVIALIASDIRQSREVSNATWERLQLAANRIGAARDAVAPLRVKP